MEVETGEVKEHPTYKRIQEYVQEKYGFKVHTAYIAEVKRSNHILVLALEPFVRKLFPDLMSFFRRHFTDVKGLDQMTRKHLRHLHSLL